MSLKCLFGHKWDGCRCAKCGKKRDQNHSWVNVNGKCEKYCAICGRIETVPHTFKKVNLTCEEHCANCGETRRILHVFQNGVCVICGAIRNMEYVKATNGFPSDNISLAQFIVKVASDFSGTGDWEPLKPACRRYAESFSCLVEDLDAAGVTDGLGRATANWVTMIYLYHRIANGNFNLRDAKKKFDNAGVSIRPGQLHPGVVYDFALKKLNPYVSESSKHTLELLPNMQSREACDTLTELVLHTEETPRSKAKLVDWMYNQAVDFVKHTMQAR